MMNRFSLPVRIFLAQAVAAVLSEAIFFSLLTINAYHAEDKPDFLMVFLAPVTVPIRTVFLPWSRFRCDPVHWVGCAAYIAILIVALAWMHTAHRKAKNRITQQRQTG